MRLFVIGLVTVVGLLLAITALRIDAAEFAVRDSRYQDALSWWDSDEEALTLEAQDLLASHDNGDAAETASLAVQQAPLNVAAIRVAGLATQALGQPDQAETIMRQAAAIGWRDAPTQLWLLTTAISRSDWTTAVQRADALARTDIDRDQVFGVLWAIASRPKGAAAISTQLALNPNWRGAFFQASGAKGNIADAGFEALGTMLAKGPSPLTDDERQDYVSGLVTGGHYARARTLWLAQLPENQRVRDALLADPNFDVLGEVASGRIKATAFAWQMQPSGDHSVSVARAGNRTSVVIDGRRNWRGRALSQTVVLTPGNYTLSAQLGARSASGLAGWHIDCLPDRSPIVRQAPLAQPLSFAVPAQGCEAQRIAVFSQGGSGEADIESVSLSRN